MAAPESELKSVSAGRIGGARMNLWVRGRIGGAWMNWCGLDKWAGLARLVWRRLALVCAWLAVGGEEMYGARALLLQGDGAL